MFHTPQEPSLWLKYRERVKRVLFLTSPTSTCAHAIAASIKAGQTNNGSIHIFPRDIINHTDFSFQSIEGKAASGPTSHKVHIPNGESTRDTKMMRIENTQTNELIQVIIH